jgi:hypothetical protein
MIKNQKSNKQTNIQKAKNNKSKLRISWNSESTDEQHKGIEQQQRIDLHSIPIRQKRHITKQNKQRLKKIRTNLKREKKQQ